MRRILLFLSFLFFLYAAWTVLDKLAVKSDNQSVFDTITSEFDRVSESEEIASIKTKLNDGIDYIATLLQTLEEKAPENSIIGENEIEKPELHVPSEQAFSIHNIELGESKQSVEKKLGPAQRTSLNEYGTNWYTYHENYHNFMMVAYDSGAKVIGLYTNQDLISSTKGIKRGTPKQDALNLLGEPMTRIQKGFVYYEFQQDRDYDVFHIDNTYVTLFYDKHENNTVTSIQIVSEALEQNREDFYTNASEQLKEGFEYQLFDLTNASRVNYGLGVLTWDEHVKETARKHSLDMAENNYFSHTNLQGQSPFDRMLEDEILFTIAGENLAYGQFSSIFAHEGLMNSMGHRENILKKEYTYLGVGVAFNTESHPYYTENFYTK
ncbi:CAP domain-containing protein [Fredinandcohnia sp. QZ13]|uniref:CAP domain-containing protein n=1 Tax=Fredinandcohnia sp. QZ13 TaxID=3073144 RepID=UPI0028530F16|nr:CAP domain-containing protein [Fredinandcohnia sp. QZ13]MDR4888829.1 CAP domain-containing protein [Fredinandcohnia sp. QZ13]